MIINSEPVLVEMIINANERQSKAMFFLKDINDFVLENKFDLVFSMEVLYYLDDPSTVIKNIYDMLNPDGRFIIGIDHYFENKPSLSWGEDYNLDLLTLSINEWKKIFKNSEFKNIEIDFYGMKDDWNGTLILYAEK